MYFQFINCSQFFFILVAFLHTTCWKAGRGSDIHDFDDFDVCFVVGYRRDGRLLRRHEAVSRVGLYQYQQDWTCSTQPYELFDCDVRLLFGFPGAEICFRVDFAGGTGFKAGFRAGFLTERLIVIISSNWDLFKGAFLAGRRLGAILGDEVVVSEVSE